MLYATLRCTITTGVPLSSAVAEKLYYTTVQVYLMAPKDLPSFAQMVGQELILIHRDRGRDIHYIVGLLSQRPAYGPGGGHTSRLSGSIAFWKIATKSYKYHQAVALVVRMRSTFVCLRPFSLSPLSERSQWRKYCFRAMFVCLCVCAQLTGQSNHWALNAK